MFENRKYTISDIHTAVKLEIDKSDSLDSVGFKPEEYDYWINSAIRNKVKRKFSGSGVKGEAFEQGVKRTNDLRTLVRATRLTVSRSSEDHDRPSVYKASLPSSYWFSISEEVDIVYPNDSTDADSLVVGNWYKVVEVSGDDDDYVTHDGTDYYDGDYFKATTTSYSESTADDTEVYECSVKRQGITESTSDTYSFRVNNPYSEHILLDKRKEAKPIRLIVGNEVELTTDGNYGIAYYYLKYLKSPQYTSISTVSSGDIEEDVYYDVSVDSITYDGTTYQPGDVFQGTTETDFSGSGEVRKTIDLPDEVLDEIIDEAANMMLENTLDPRYQTHTIETRQSE